MSRRFLLKSAGFTAMGFSFPLPAVAGDDCKPGAREAAAFEKPTMKSECISSRRTTPQPRPDTDFSLVWKVAEIQGDGPDHHGPSPAAKAFHAGSN